MDFQKQIRSKISSSRSSVSKYEYKMMFFRKPHKNHSNLIHYNNKNFQLYMRWPPE
jgi:hypothetical protein